MSEPVLRTRSCFVCGVANPLGLNLEFHPEGDSVRTRFRPRPEHVGFKQTIHGGLLATLLDEAMSWACGVRTGRFAYCAELAVRFLHPARPGVEYVVIGKLVANRRNKLFEARGELREPGGVVVATGAGKYLPVPADVVRGMQDDFVGDLGEALKQGAGK